MKCLHNRTEHFTQSFYLLILDNRIIKCLECGRTWDNWLKFQREKEEDNYDHAVSN